MPQFGHVLGDGLVVVHYRPDLPPEQLDGLRAFITGSEGGGVLGGPEPGQAEAFKAVALDETLVCADFSLAPLVTFTQQWFNRPGQ